MDIEILTSLRGRKLTAWEHLLENTGLVPEEMPEQIVLLWEGDDLAATGSRQGNILKYLAVDPAHQGEGLLATLLTALRQEAFQKGHRHLFLYTKPSNEYLFLDLMFYPVAATDQVLLMEDKPNGVKSFLQTLPVETEGGTVGAAVMNCDPFTLGHRYLVESAARECDHFYVFVLSEDQGHFSAADRLAMVKAGTADLKNVTVLPTGPYLISAATFPTYFLKDRDGAEQVQCLLDIAIFCKYFAPHFGITRRYVGTEPLSPMTNKYNAALKANLPAKGIAVRELARFEKAGAPVSASAVRKAMTEGDWDTFRSLVPPTTFEHLQKTSKEDTLCKTARKVIF